MRRRRGKVKQNTSAYKEDNNLTGDTVLQPVFVFIAVAVNAAYSPRTTKGHSLCWKISSNSLCVLRLLDFWRTIAFEMCAPYVTRKHTRSLSFSLAHSLARARSCVRVCRCGCVCLSVYAHFCFRSRRRVIVVGYPISVLHAVSRYTRDSSDSRHQR